MTPAITDQMRQALDAEHGQPVKIVDERTSQVYYVISAAQFETMRALFAEGEFEPREAYPLIAKTAAEAGGGLTPSWMPTTITADKFLFAANARRIA